jgi:hypothetical protein
MIFFKYEIKQGTHAEFVDFWSIQYDTSQDAPYEKNIAKPLTAGKIRELFVWKNGSPLSELKAKSVEKNFVEKAGLLAKLPANDGAAEFLARFPNGGAIWRIFWLHCWQPERFPIYDMHVHRAMEFIEKQELVEIPSSDAGKIDSYFNKYLPFYARFKESSERRTAHCGLTANFSRATGFLTARNAEREAN